jgi:hypothetical protein
MVPIALKTLCIPIACQILVFLIQEEDREERKKES